MQLLVLELVHQRRLANTSLNNQNNRDRPGHPHHQQREGRHRVSLRQTLTAQDQRRWGRAGPQ
eukprot:13687-Pleurochrysis_carterae.AAC.1